MEELLKKLQEEKNKLEQNLVYLQGRKDLIDEVLNKLQKPENKEEKTE